MKPKLKRFKEVAFKCDGNISKIADWFGVERCTIYRWIETDSGYKQAIEEYRGRLLDRCLETAATLANGFPKMENTPEGTKQIGWIVPPDGNTLRYLLSTLGRKEGFGETLDVTTKGESIKQEPLIIEVIDKREQVLTEI